MSLEVPCPPGDVIRNGDYIGWPINTTLFGTSLLGILKTVSSRETGPAILSARNITTAAIGKFLGSMFNYSFGCNIDKWL